MVRLDLGPTSPKDNRVMSQHETEKPLLNESQCDPRNQVLLHTSLSECPPYKDSQLTTVSLLCHGQCLVNDIHPMELRKTWDTCRTSRNLEIVVVSDAGS